MTDKLKPVSAITIAQMKARSEPISALAIYDHITASIVDRAGVDLALVGDSLGMVFCGESSTLRVTLDQIAYHTRVARRGLKRAFLVADMPFFSTSLGIDSTMKNVADLVRAGAGAVKIEGASPETLAVTRRIVEAGVPVMGHVGLTPQSALKLGGHKMQGREEESARAIIDGAVAIESAGAFAVVLECVPPELAGQITERLTIPTIGIGAGPHCSGQILVAADIFGLTLSNRPKFVKQYDNLAERMFDATRTYIEDVKSGRFPDRKGASDI